MEFDRKLASTLVVCNGLMFFRRHGILAPLRPKDSSRITIQAFFANKGDALFKLKIRVPRGIIKADL